MQEIFSPRARGFPEQTEKQEANGNLGETAANQNGRFQGEVPFPHLDLLLRRQMNDVLAEALRYLQAVEAEGEYATDLVERPSNKWTDETGPILLGGKNTHHSQQDGVIIRTESVYNSQANIHSQGDQDEGYCRGDGYASDESRGPVTIVIWQGRSHLR